MIEIENKINCCGCTACKSICPKECIEMKDDEEGFLYPVVDEDKCISCDMCEKVCPIINNGKEKKLEQKAYIVNNKNNTVREESTSGGAFSAIAEYVVEKNGVVFGAAFNNDFSVIHKFVESKQELKEFRNSKYVQSNLKDCFIETKKFLKEGRYVCFSGTPCQIEGLKSFLEKDYDNLITVDVVCRAVPSPLVWKKYLKYIKEEKLKDSEIENILFRDKSKYGYKYSTMTIKTNKEEYRNGVETDPYLRAFFKDLSDRPSCYDCQFRKHYRISDFTIWDCFNVEDFEKSLDDNIGTTRILTHSKKGEQVFQVIKEKFDYIEVPVEKLVKDVKEMYYSVHMNENREKFFNNLNVMKEKEFFNKYFPDSIKVKIERNVRKILVKTKFYKNIKKIAKKILKKERNVNE